MATAPQEPKLADHGARRACIFSLDDTYIMPFEVLFTSLLATQSIPDGTPLYFIHGRQLSPDGIARLSQFLSGHGRTAQFLDATPRLPALLPRQQTDHVSEATYYRLFSPSILPPTVEEAVYFDVDMLALRSVRELFTIKLRGPIAAVDHFAPAEGVRLWGAEGGAYFQAGLLLIPLQRWRAEGTEETFRQILRNESRRLRWWDQDVLNLAFHGAWDRLPVWLNVAEAVRHQVSKQDLLEKAKLLHYSGSCKPWNSSLVRGSSGPWYAAYEQTYGQAFPCAGLRPHWLKTAIRARVSGLLWGRR